MRPRPVFFVCFPAIFLVAFVYGFNVKTTSNLHHKALLQNATRQRLQPALYLAPTHLDADFSEQSTSHLSATAPPKKHLPPPNSCLLLATRPTKIGNVCYLNPGLAPPFSLATTAPSPVFRVWKSKGFGNLARSPVFQRGAARENKRPCRHLRITLASVGLAEKSLIFRLLATRLVGEMVGLVAIAHGCTHGW